MRGLIIVAILSLFMACTPSSSEVENISVIELKNRLDANRKIQLLDVRTPSEWDEGTLDSALRIDVLSEDFETKVDKALDKNKQVYVYCRSGGRSVKASEILAKKGYKVINIEGGYNAWKAKVAPVK